MSFPDARFSAATSSAALRFARRAFFHVTSRSVREKTTLGTSSSQRDIATSLGDALGSSFTFGQYPKKPS